jgi:hypothetical protein
MLPGSYPETISFQQRMNPAVFKILEINLKESSGPRCPVGLVFINR